MHPQIQLPKPGKCPICFMDLIPLETGELGGDESPRRLVMSETARKLAQIQTATVQRQVATAEIRMVGKVDYDETRLVHVTAWVPGRLDRLFVDYTGIFVRNGDHMVYIYSPELLSAQQELLEARRAVVRLQRSDQPLMKQTALQTVESAREKLRLWGLSVEQISEIETRGEPTDHMTIYAPTGGIVVEKHVAEGMYVGVGTRIYTIADLSRVWVLLDAYESDMSWIRYGQEVEFETVAYPGEIFSGRVTFIDPVLDARTRTVKVRVNVENPDGKLKPQMFVRAVARAHVAGGGRVMDPALSGKWVCPMHPEVIADGPGTCRECGMDLVESESLGYVSAKDTQPDLMVPVSAVLVTGRRAVVYVEVADAEQPTYEGREIVIGPRAGDYYQVKSGLQEEERVVVKGSFKIDSALQIQARPSMMSSESGRASTAHACGERVSELMSPIDLPGSGTHGEHARQDQQSSTQASEFTESLSSLYSSYFALHRRLAEDDLAGAKASLLELESSIREARMEVLDSEGHATWMRLAEHIREGAKKGARAADLKAARRAFSEISKWLLSVEERFDHPGDTTHYQIHCPMAFDNQGAEWLQASKAVSNPYFGAKMARCGVVQGEYPPAESGESRTTP
jgi:Cu(I)/Ag(I) efflux system membrane fusion protein